MFKEKDIESMSKKELEALVQKLTKDMHTAAAELNFEKAAELRDKLVELKKELLGIENDQTKSKTKARRKKNV